ncbi:MAG: PRC-barrel domain-containing protein [Candidatus Aenigmatarchaeota archaeon]
MVTTCNYAETVKKDVFTTRGSYCGKISDLDLDLEKFRVKSIVVDIVKGSFLAPVVREKRGVIVPFSMVQSIGDIVIIKHITPTVEEQSPAEAAPQAE